jgi:hypothetical protein
MKNPVQKSVRDQPDSSPQVLQDQSVIQNNSTMALEVNFNTINILQVAFIDARHCRK